MESNFKDNLKNNGYAVIDIENINILNDLRSTLIKKLNIAQDIESIEDVREEIAKMSKSEVNKSMIDLLKQSNLSEMMIEAFPSLVKQLCGNELFIQRRATVVMNLPGEGQAKQWPHYELMSGISPFTYVIWVPLHDLEKNSGVYYLKLEKSLEIMKKEEEEGLVNGPTVLNLINEGSPLPLKYGQGVVFNPFVLHGNIKFSSKLARIACTVRFQSCSKPLLQKNSDYLKYYKLN
tara:strand:+ start:451 stop:1155 length:705 start_codon:yes stop_codon:yes gene_type:complete